MHTEKIIVVIHKSSFLDTLTSLNGLNFFIDRTRLVMISAQLVGWNVFISAKLVNWSVLIGMFYFCTIG